MPREITNKSVSNAGKFQSFFKKKDGNFVLEQIDDLTGYNENTYNSDPYDHAFNAGMRQVGVLIHKLLETDIKKLKEAVEAKKGNENG